MKASIQTKLLTMCILLVLLTVVSISGIYYVLTKQDKQRESLQRIQIAFDIILDDFTDQLNSYKKGSEDFLESNPTLPLIPSVYSKDENKIGSKTFITSFLVSFAQKIKEFGQLVSADQAAVYAAGNRRLLAVYQRDGDQEHVGGYVVSETGSDAYLALDDPSQVSGWLVLDRKPIPDAPLPDGIAAYYEGDIPESLSIGLFSQGQTLGLRILAPLYESESIIGILICELAYTQPMADRYASLSKTEVNFFAENQLSVGTLPAQAELEATAMEEIASCGDIRAGDFHILSVIFDNQEYYQGQCGLKNAQGKTVGAVSVSLSQEIEQEEINKILTSVFTLSGIVIAVAFGLSVIVSRKTVRSIQNIVRVVAAASEGDLRQTALAVTQDEIGMLAVKLNQMIGQLRTISGQVQHASDAVSATADTILQQMRSLIQHMHQQSSSVDNTAGSIENIKQFIDIVAENTIALLSAAGQILSSIQESRASIEEVTISTDSLSTNLLLISSSVDQVSQVVKQISENTGHLEEVVRQTETEIHHIDQSLRDVSHNADRAQELAKETMDAATRGRSSVDESIQGMTELKEVVTNTAQIIREVNSWGEQVSSILDIVDEITEQTSLLALNASIISAQAGTHGRGFAIVADEIKELATRTKASTKEIGTLVHELQAKTEEGVNNTEEGLRKADRSMQLANAVKDALISILEQATRSSNGATDTAQVIQQTAASSQAISVQISNVTEMVSDIRKALQEGERDIEQVGGAVENISGMSKQVSRASVEQKKAAQEIERNMQDVAEKFGDISDQTETLQQNTNQLLTAMHTIESTTAQILENATTISGDTVEDLVQQSDMLQKIVKVLKIS